jgi:MFS family permease
MTAIVPDAQRGILMSLAVAVGQGGFALAGILAGPIYVAYGYFSNTLIGAIAILLMALLVAVVIPEPEGDMQEEDAIPAGADVGASPTQS